MNYNVCHIHRIHIGFLGIEKSLVDAVSGQQKILLHKCILKVNDVTSNIDVFITVKKTFHLNIYYVHY